MLRTSHGTATRYASRFSYERRFDEKKYPTEAGYYWVRYTDSGGEPFIVKVNKYRDSDRLYADPGVCVPLKRFPIDWLSGKLEPPNDKEQNGHIAQQPQDAIALVDQLIEMYETGKWDGDWFLIDKLKSYAGRQRASMR